MNAPSKPVMRLGLAALCGVMAMALLYFREQQLLLKQSGGQRVAVSIAKSESKAGDRVNADNLGVHEIPTAYLHINAIRLAAQDKIAGRKVYRRIRPNQNRASLVIAGAAFSDRRCGLFSAAHRS